MSIPTRVQHGTPYSDPGVFTGLSNPTAVNVAGIPPPGASQGPGQVSAPNILQDGNSRTNRYAQYARVVDMSDPDVNASAATMQRGEVVFVRRHPQKRMNGAGGRLVADSGSSKYGPGKGVDRMSAIVSVDYLEACVHRRNEANNAYTGIWDDSGDNPPANVPDAPMQGGLVLHDGQTLFDTRTTSGLSAPLCLYPYDDNQGRSTLITTTRLREEVHRAATGAAVAVVPGAVGQRPALPVAQGGAAIFYTGLRHYRLRAQRGADKHENKDELGISPLDTYIMSQRYERVRAYRQVQGGMSNVKVPQVEAYRSLQKFQAEVWDGAKGLTSSWNPDGIVMGVFGSAERWDSRGDEHDPSSFDASMDRRQGALYNIAVQGHAIATSWSDKGAASMVLPRKYVALPRDKLYVLIVALKVNDANGGVNNLLQADPRLPANGAHTQLRNFSLLRTTSADMTGIGKKWLKMRDNADRAVKTAQLAAVLTAAAGGGAPAAGAANFANLLVTAAIANLGGLPAINNAVATGKEPDFTEYVTANRVALNNAAVPVNPVDFVDVRNNAVRSYQNPLNILFPKEQNIDGEKGNDFEKKIIGGWEIGSVTDAAAAPSILPKMLKRKRAATMSMGACVNIKWVDSFTLHERYFVGHRSYPSNGP
jgi:hypothetical protein